MTDPFKRLVNQVRNFPVLSVVNIGSLISFRVTTVLETMSMDYYFF